MIRVIHARQLAMAAFQEAGFDQPTALIQQLEHMVSVCFMDCKITWKFREF